MAFQYASNFSIHQLNAFDGQSKELKELRDAACPGAGHRSAERGDAPKCHPETRKAVLNDIMSWVDSANPKESLMWLSGPAGAGKSSIAQTVCEQCDDEYKLLASFFFSRSAVGTGRDNGNRLVPTIAIQLTIAMPETKVQIIEKLEKDPLLLNYSMEEQMRQLILEPLTTTLATRSNKEIVPYLVVIDGLDECFDRFMQAKIITTFAAISSKANFRFRCLIASRPELEIRNTFNAYVTSETCARIVLDQHYNPDEDIRIYLQSGFASLKRRHTLMTHLSQDSNWPSSKDIEWLVEKSSGQFIFASIIIKYLEEPRRNPRTSLRAIIDHTISDNESPYSALDVLYKFILKSAEEKTKNGYQSLVAVFQVLLYANYSGCIDKSVEWTFWFRVCRFLGYKPKWINHRSEFRIADGLYMTDKGWSLPNLAFFLSMAISDLELLLSDLHSVLFIPKSDSKKTVISFYHASLGDFLKDPSRSGQFFINEKNAHNALAQRCLHTLSEIQSRADKDMDNEKVLSYCRFSYLHHIEEGGYSRPLKYFFKQRAKLIKLRAHIY